MDRRRLGQRFKHADVYLQWIDFWREQIANENIAEITGATTPNYYVVPAGEVSDTGADTAADICNFLFQLLISDASVMDAFEGIREADAERDLSLDVSAAFAEWSILADGPTLHVRHPIKKREQIRGFHATHQPSFSQRNGKLYVFEAIDFNAKKAKLLRERAGFMAYTFIDIRQKVHDDLEAYSIVRPLTVGNEPTDAIEYAKNILRGESNIIDWADLRIRNAFLEERRRVAESFG